MSEQKKREFLSGDRKPSPLGEDATAHNSSVASGGGGFSCQLRKAKMRNKKKICKRCARPISSNLRFCSSCYEARRRERAQMLDLTKLVERPK